MGGNPDVVIGDQLGIVWAIPRQYQAWQSQGNAKLGNPKLGNPNLHSFICIWHLLQVANTEQDDSFLNF